MAQTIERSIEIAAPIERVWEALTDHTQFGTWFLAKLDQPFRVGATSTGHITYPGYEHLPWKAEVVAMDPPRRFVWRWPHMDEALVVREDWPWTTVAFTLEPVGEGTRVTVVESGFEALDPAAAARAFESNSGGWTEQMENIRRYVEG